ncbi:MAG: thioesterase family protein [Sphingopyxis sp.]|nr:thioesterase family protein [Sphingopyxis sp.]
MSLDTITVPHYFSADGEGFDPSGLARNPWFADAVAGGPIAALIGHIVEDAGFDPDLEICRLTIDILGIVPRTLLVPRIVPVRQGRQAQLHRVELLAGGKLVAQAHVLRARHLDTPEFPPPQPHQQAAAPDQRHGDQRHQHAPQQQPMSALSIGDRPFMLGRRQRRQIGGGRRIGVETCRHFFRPPAISCRREAMSGAGSGKDHKRKGPEHRPGPFIAADQKRKLAVAIRL